MYAGGVAAWSLCLLWEMVRDDGSARQTVVLLALLAVFLVALLWSTWRLWEAGTHRPGRRTEVMVATPADQV
ncbi:hypothetical protein D9753_34065 [Streptomyces dangxiongensis]|uniref:Uncharacterized protein n=1 Tax=Streptomyces dangxiongensis TaxID=1442032 RepID=A0A3G2JR39_9ACTN|nr:hypothetical protein D9753_34065 [Streptomyces dangxiongensis]